MINMRIKKILSTLEENGYDAYIVGGYVRDYVLGNETFDVDISTSAKPKEIKEIFDLTSGSVDTYGSISFKDSLYNYDITTFRRDIKYIGRKPVDYDFIESKEEDVLRRDFTINGLYMDSTGKIIDLVGGIEDINRKIIRVIGNMNEKMVEDPLRMLRAIRFASKLDFELEESLYRYIKQNKQLISSLSYERRKSELDLIFSSNNYEVGLTLLKELGILDVLEINYDKVKSCSNKAGIWAQIEYNKNYPFPKSERKIIECVNRILKYGTIDNITLYECGLYPCIIAGEVLGISKSNISDMYRNLPIYSCKDLKFSGIDVMNVLKLKPSKKVKDIIKDIEINVLSNEIKNEYEEIKQYVIKNWR